MTGISRAKRIRTTHPGPLGGRPVDLVERGLRRDRTEPAAVADITYVLVPKTGLVPGESVTYELRGSSSASYACFDASTGTAPPGLETLFDLAVSL